MEIETTLCELTTSEWFLVSSAESPLLCIETGADLFPELETCDLGDRFLIRLSEVALQRGLRIVSIREDDLMVELDGERFFYVTRDAINVLQEFCDGLKSCEAWVTVEKIVQP